MKAENCRICKSSELRIILDYGNVALADSFLKSKDEMAELFKDLPEALDNTGEIVSKIETPDLKRDILLPNFALPEGFSSEDEYLRKLTYDGAKSRFSKIISY